MKILHVLDHSIPMHSGYTFRTRSIIQQQRALGWETVHATSAKHTLDCEKEETIEGLHFYRTRPARSFLHRLPAVQQMAITWDLSQRLAEVVQKEKPDVIHAHSPALNGIAAYRVAKKYGLPLVYECRAFWEDAAVNLGSCSDHSLRYRLTRAMENYVFTKADAITTICEGLRQDIIERGHNSEKITVIPNAVDIEKFTEDGVNTESLERELGLEDKIVLGFFGSFYEYEGLQQLLEAMSEIHHCQPRAHLLLVGGGPEEQRISEQIQKLNLTELVTLTGRVPHDEIQNYYQLTDIMVYPRLPMRLTDLVTPLKPLEAMAKRKLVIASDVGGHKELIDDGATGYLFRAGSSSALAQCVIQAIKEKPQWSKIHERGREYVENTRNWKRSVSYYKDAYEKACSI